MKKYLKELILIIGIIFCVSEASADNFNYRNFTIGNGLPSSQVYNVIQGENGYLWFATDKGVCRYDGYEFKTLDLKDKLTDEVVLHLYLQPNGDIWGAMMNGALFHFDPSTMVVKPYKYNSELKKSIKGYHIINSLYVDQEKVYLGFNTLAQSETLQQQDVPNKKTIRVKGKGTELSNSRSLTNRAKKKMLTQRVVKSLIDIGENKGGKKLQKMLWNTYYCLSKIHLNNGKMHGNYCKTKICTVCNGIRKAELINKYLPLINTWEEPYLVTLTAKSVPAKSLDKRINQMLRGFRMITNKYKTRHQRGKSIKLMGIRSLECNFNPKRRTYNPHFHIIVPNKETAEILNKEWQILLTSKFTYKKAQHFRKVKDTERDMVDVVKYGSKIFTDPTMSKDKTITPYIYASALYNILSAMKGHRLYQNFGFNLTKELATKKRTTKTITNYQELDYDNKLSDWVDREKDEVLTGYIPDLELLGILEYNINVELS